MNRFNKTESAIFVSLVCSLLPGDLYSEFIIKNSLKYNGQLGLFIVLIPVHKAASVLSKSNKSLIYREDY